MTHKQVKCSEVLHRQLKTESAKRGVNMEDMVDAALRGFLQSPDALREFQRPSVVPTHTQLLERLYRILTSGDRPVIEAVTQDINLFHDRLRPQMAVLKAVE